MRHSNADAAEPTPAGRLGARVRRGDAVPTVRKARTARRDPRCVARAAQWLVALGSVAVAPRAVAQQRATVAGGDAHGAGRPRTALRAGNRAAPSWALREERRAPKMPDAGRYWRELAAPQRVDALVDGLLICHVGVATASRPGDFPWGSWHLPRGRDWDTLNGPDLRLRFQFRGETVGLYGPDDHWEMFVSIPAVTLRRGDRVRVDAWDRDVTSDERIGGVSAVYAGEFPWRFSARHLRFDCRGADDAQARAWAAPWAARVDAAIERIARAQPDAAAAGFGAPVEIEALRSNWRLESDASFRYYAGFLGWHDGEVQARLARYRDEVRAWNARARAAGAGRERASER